MEALLAPTVPCSDTDTCGAGEELGVIVGLAVGDVDAPVDMVMLTVTVALLDSEADGDLESLGEPVGDAEPLSLTD
jgi:hypothetical protein